MDPRLIDFLAQQSVDAPAPVVADAGSPQGGMLQSLYLPAMLVGLMAFMYFFTIRPQRKEEKRKKDLLGSLKKGDTVVTLSGIIGSVHALKDDTVILRVGDNTRVEMLRSAIQDVRSRSTGVEKAEKDESK